METQLLYGNLLIFFTWYVAGHFFSSVNICNWYGLHHKISAMDSLLKDLLVQQIMFDHLLGFPFILSYTKEALPYINEALPYTKEALPYNTQVLPYTTSAIHNLVRAVYFETVHMLS